MKNPGRLVILAALLAFAAKIYCAASTIGTNDVALFHFFAKAIEEDGLLALYPRTALFNHTPMIGELISAALWLDQVTPLQFQFWLRLPAIAADLLAVFALLWLRARTGQPAWWALMVFALSPVSFMVSGFHGNVDPVLVAFLVIAGCACVAKQPALCGLFLGLACNVKVIPLLLAPAFFFFWVHRAGAVRFAATCAAVVLVGWSLPLLAVPSQFLGNVLGYGGYWGDWGITVALRSTGLPQFRPTGFVNLTATQTFVSLGLKILIIGAAIAIGWHRRAREHTAIFSTIALVWVFFFVVAPGGAAQYLVWFAPFLLIHSDRWYVAVTASSTMFLAVFYSTISGGLPWYFGISTAELAPIWRPWTLLPWLTLAALLGTIGWEFVRRGWRRTAELRELPESRIPGPSEAADSLVARS